MIPIIPPIKPGDTGPPVANLQEALFVLLQRNLIRAFDDPNHPTLEELAKLIETLKREHAQSLFGDATQQLILHFQVQQGLGRHLGGIVEAPTSDSINEWLKSIGAFDEGPRLIVRGTVKDADDQPIPGASVRAFDRDLRKEQPLGIDKTNERGEYTITYGKEQFAGGDVPAATTPKLIVRAIVDEQRIGGDVYRPQPSRDEVVDFKVPAPRISEWEKLSTGIMPLLEGQDDEGGPLPPWKIKDGDLDFIAEETGLEREKIRLWALAFALGRDVAEILRPELSVEPPVRSHLAVKNDVSAFAIIYSWLRDGLPADPTALWATPTEKLLTTGATAVAQGIAPSSIGADSRDLRNRIEQIKLDSVLKGTAPGTTASLGDLLATLPEQLPADQQRRVAAAIADLRPEDPDLVKRIAGIEGFDGNSAPAVARTLRIGALTGGHLPMARALQSRLQAEGESEGTLRPLASLGPDEWLDLAYTHSAPEGITLTPVAFADALSAGVERLYPHAALAAHFKDKRRLAQHAALAEVGTFLLGDHQNFDIVTANLNAIKGQPEQLVDGLRSLQRMNTLGASWEETAALLENDFYGPDHILAAGPAQLAASLQGRISPERAAELYIQAEELHNTTFAVFTAAMSPLNAPRILPMNQGGFPPGPDDGPGLPVLPKQPTELELLAQLVDKVQTDRRNELLSPAGFTLPHREIKGHFRGDPEVRWGDGTVVEHHPTLQALFGSQDACACGHCNSVLSPAAYFVDLLQFVKNAGMAHMLLGDPGLSDPGLRPDLQDIELSCNNSKTEVPSIDLALEILENAVVFAPSGLVVNLPLGTKVNDQLPPPAIEGERVQVTDNVREVLQTTVRTLLVPDEVWATWDKGGTDWTVVAGHRRWKLTALPEVALMVNTGSELKPAPVDLNTAEVIDALNRKDVPNGAKAAFAKLFDPNLRPDYEDYSVTITPQPDGKSWLVKYRFVVRVRIDAPVLFLETSTGSMWRMKYKPSLVTVQQAEGELAKNIIPALVKTLVALRFPETSRLSVKADESGAAGSWTITSDERNLLLSRTPAKLTITSLAYQSGDPSADATAEPENHNPAAYARLNHDDVVFPWSLPLDLPLEEVRLYLERARSSRRRLMELTAPAGQPLGDSIDFALEVLRLSRAEARLIAEQRQDPYECWGVSSDQKKIWDAAAAGYVDGSALELLQNVSILLQQSRLSFEELQAVLATRFVLGGVDPLRITPLSTCKPSEMKVASLTTGHLDRIHRFVRLQRRLGWSALDLDAALQIAGGALGYPTLQKLAGLVQLHELLGLPVAKVVAWWSRPEALGNQPELARALGLTINELKHAIALFEISDAFASGETLGFCQRVKKFQRGGIAFQDLRYLLQHVEAPEAAIHLDVKQLKGLALAALGAAGSISGTPEKRPPLASTGRLENDKIADATRRVRENAVIASLASGLGAAPELVEELLRIRLRNPENSNESAITVFLATPGDFIDLPRLVEKLQTHSDPLTADLWSRFSDAHRAVLLQSDPKPLLHETTLVAALNAVLGGTSIFDSARFGKVELSEETLSLNPKPPIPEDLIRLNRLLLEDAFPLEIEKRRLSKMSFVAAFGPQPDSAVVTTVIVRLYKAVFLCSALKLSRADLRLIRSTPNDENGFSALDFNTLPPSTKDDKPAAIHDFEQLLTVPWIRSLASNAGSLLKEYAALTFVGLGGAVWSSKRAHQVLETGLALTKDQVDAAAKRLSITTGDEYRDPIRLFRLIGLLAALKQLGAIATVKHAADLIAPSPTGATALIARALLRGRYSESQWRDLIKPIADKLRKRQRDALVDYLIGRDARPRDGDANPQIYTGERLRGANDLYERYLIDVQTGPCLKTTRLLQATAAVQLFIQRVLLNLYKDKSLSDDKRKLWDWMHCYRVWEANRKVFLFPENWLLPELRDDKTAIFRQMESVLTEQEPSPETTRAALLTYLEELGDLAQISVIAMYQEQTTLYVVGRTPNQPYRYFWRSCANFGGPKMSWSGWEALDLDNASDFIMPFVMDGDLHVAWPIFRETAVEKDPETHALDLFWDVQIAWQRRTGQGWTKRKMSQAALSSVERQLGISELRSFVFKVRKHSIPLPMAPNLSQDRILIDCYAATDPKRPPGYGYGQPVEKRKAPTHTAAFAGPQRNVYLAVSAQVWERYKLKPEKDYPDPFFRPSITLSVTLHFFEAFNDLAKTGGIDRSIPLILNGGIGWLPGLSVGNGYDMTLTITDSKGVVKDGLTRGNNKPGENYTIWSWDPVFVVDIGTLQDKDNQYLPDREVVFEQSCGSFVLQARHDVTTSKQMAPDKLEKPQDMTYLANRFTTTGGGNNISLMGDGSLPVRQDLSPPVLITSPTGVRTASSLDKPGCWHVHDSNGAWYVRKRGNYWSVWPDGQDFAGKYRSLAAASTFALFDPAVQGMRRDGPQTLSAPPPSPPPPYNTTSPTISFVRTSPYANYNWELFLHAPLAIADYLASQQRFEEARRWLHAVFDPTTEEKLNRVPQFWRFLEFKNAAQPDSIAQMLTWLANPETTDPKVKNFEEDFAARINDWKQDPFMPHLIARLRPSAYQWHTFFAYLDVLIGWGDQLFRRDTRESVNDATMLYVLAAKLLGPRPRTIPAPTPPPPQTYRSLRANNIDAFGNAWVQYADLPGTKKLCSGTAQRAAASQAQVMSGVAGGTAIAKQPTRTQRQNATSLTSLAFCIPQNEKVTEFYARVEERLFNVRNCRNIEGVFRNLPLYEPPIDPLLLIRARAAGLDLDDVTAELYAPLPNYRFSFTLQKALEFCAELKALGGALLTALEKKDAEELTLLRSGHEIAMLKMVRETRKQQIAEGEANIAALQQSEATILERFGQYQKLLGKTSITKGQDGLPVVEQSSSLAVSTDPVGGTSGLGLSRMDVAQLNWMATANSYTQAANSVHLVTAILSMFPDVWVGAITAGQTFGGANLGGAANAAAKAIEMGTVNANYLANLAGTFAGYERRQDEWVHQSKLALAELKQIQKQIIAAQIRKDIAERELTNHDKQIENAQEVEAFMRGKFTNQQLYRWMSSQIAQVYFRTYQLALDQAKRAERTYQHELGLDTATTPFVKGTHWESLKRGLLAGEHLHHDLKRMESAYLERNVREFEITKHISLLQLNPGALIALKLKETNKCEFDLPEALFDLDYPGHYMRRIKMVSLSIPCVVGPYASVSATLKLTKSETRVKPTEGTYEREPKDDLRFVTTAATITAIVTSSAQQDSGMFEPNMRDERYLPFEGAGAISSWNLSLPEEFRPFDYETISDVVLHVRYTARDGGEGLKTVCRESLKDALSEIKLVIKDVKDPLGLARLFSLRHEFSTEWHRFLNPPAGDQKLTMTVGIERFPFLFRDSSIAITAINLFVKMEPEFDASKLRLSLNVGAAASTNLTFSGTGFLIPKETLPAGPLNKPWTITAWIEGDVVSGGVPRQRLDSSAIYDILLVCRYTLPE